MNSIIALVGLGTLIFGICLTVSLVISNKMQNRNRLYKQYLSQNAEAIGLIKVKGAGVPKFEEHKEEIIHHIFHKRFSTAREFSDFVATYLKKFNVTLTGNDCYYLRIRYWSY